MKNIRNLMDVFYNSVTTLNLNGIPRMHTKHEIANFQTNTNGVAEAQLKMQFIRLHNQ